MIDRLIDQLPDHLSDDGRVLIVQSSVTGTAETLDRLQAIGLTPTVVQRRRGPLGPILRGRVDYLIREGLIRGPAARGGGPRHSRPVRSPWCQGSASDAVRAIRTVFGSAWRAGRRRRRPRRRVSSARRVTILFCDVAGSTALGERLDPEALRRVMRRYFDEMSAIVERHGGTVEKFIGDAVMAVFGIPTVREDDALRAVRAAAEIRERLPAVAEELGVALSFRTGDQHRRGGRRRPAQHARDRRRGERRGAARAGRAARARSCSAPTRAGSCATPSRSRPSSRWTLKGKTEPVPAFRLLGVDPPRAGARAPLRRAARRPRARAASCFAALDRAVRERQLPSVHAARPGGRRQVAPERRAARGLGGEATVVSGRCLHYGEGITFWPLVEILMQLGEPAADGPRARVSDGRRRRRRRSSFWDVRRLLEAAAARAPARRGLRRPALGRADAARPARARRRPVARRADPAAVHRPPGAARRAPGLGRRQAQRHDGAARAALRRPSARRCSTQLGDGLDAATARADRRRRRGQPALPRGDGRARPRERRRRRACRRRSRRCSPPGSSGSATTSATVLERGVGRGRGLPPRRGPRAAPTSPAPASTRSSLRSCARS